MTGRPSLLELLHPDRTCPGTLLIGSGCPVAFRPWENRGEGELDLVIIDPSPEEAHTDGWLDREVTRAAALLAPDGLICALVPAGYRGRLGRLLADFRVEMESAFLYLRSVTGEDDLLPLQGKALQQLANMLPGRHSLRGRLQGRIVGWPGVTAILRRWHPGALIIGRRPGSYKPPSMADADLRPHSTRSGDVIGAQFWPVLTARAASSPESLNSHSTNSLPDAGSRRKLTSSCKPPMTFTMSGSRLLRFDSWQGKERYRCCWRRWCPANLPQICF